jgi:lipopolysaccharide/colanic/teichoic acid biosynthesis glycosyltransferase
VNADRSDPPKSHPAHEGMSRMNVKSSRPADPDKDSVFLNQQAFVARLLMEQRRTERSRRPFVLLLLESETLFKSNHKHAVSQEIVSLLSSSLRETDVKGWYESESSIGIIFTEIGSTDDGTIAPTLVTKIRTLLSEKLTDAQVAEIKFTVFLFPQDWDKESQDGGSAATLYPGNDRKISHLMKRVMDIAGSLPALILTSPLLLLIAIVIKLTSKGPILYRQERVGQYGRKFTFLKFRSMYVNNNHAIHREYVKSLILGSAAQQRNGNGSAAYKLTNDPRITAAGRMLRKTSLDELPQFLNVLKGEMSLVGPRPPIPYEVADYDIWHRRRLLAVKPGITGLWQVKGRNRTTFDEMVRLDLQYAKSWSVWLDLKILLQTPRAVVDGNGAC